MADSDDDNDLFGGDSDSDDTAELLQNSTNDKKPKAAAKPQKKDDDDDAGGLFDSDSDDDDDNNLATDEKKKRLEALAKKRKKKEPKESSSPSSQRNKPKDGNRLKKGDEGYESADSYDSTTIERTADDDAFIDTTGEDAEAVNELYAEQRFSDDRPDKTQKKKKRRSAQQEEDANDPVMSVVNRMKKKTKTKKNLSDIEDEVKVFLHQMDVAAERDEIAIAERKPALNKVNMLADVCDMLTKKDMQRTLLDYDLLAACKRWIAPLRKGGLGNITVRTRILESISKLPITSNDLKRSDFGKVVMILYKHPKETPALKRLLKNLIEEWSRPIFRKSGAMKDLDRFERPTAASSAIAPSAGANRSDSKLPKQDLDSLISTGRSKEAALTSSQQRVQVPFSRGFSYSVRPADRSSPIKSASQPRGEIRDNLKRRMVEKGRKVSKNQRSANLSVEGRATK